MGLLFPVRQAENGGEDGRFNTPHFNGAVFGAQDLADSPQTSPDAGVEVILDGVVGPGLGQNYLPSMSFEIYVHLFPYFFWA